MDAAIPNMALKEVVFWIIAILIMGIVTGAATKVGAILVGKMWPKEDKKDRRQEPNWLHELMDIQKTSNLSNHEVSESNKEIAGEIKQFAKSLQALTEFLLKTVNESTRDHADILSAVHDLDVPRRRRHAS